MRFYHVASPEYREGEDLYSYDELCSMGYDPKWRWDGEPFDTDLVFLFESLEEAEEFRANFQPQGQILVVDLLDDTHIVPGAEGYPAVYRKIDAKYIN